MGTLMRGHPLIREHFLRVVSYLPNGTCDEGHLSCGDTLFEILKCPLKTGLLYTKKVKHLVKGHLYTVKPLISEIPLHSEPPCMIRTPLYHSTSDQTHLQSNLWLEDIYICSQTSDQGLSPNSEIYYMDTPLKTETIEFKSKNILSTFYT